MAGARKNQGAARLARALDGRMERRARRPPNVDLATVRGDLSLLLDHFGIPIPATDYIVVERFAAAQTSLELADPNRHSHEQAAPIAAGDRVLVHILDADTDSPTFIVADRLPES